MKFKKLLKLSAPVLALLLATACSDGQDEVNPDEEVKILVKFNNKGIYMYHCHILEHEEAGMMGQIKID